MDQQIFDYADDSFDADWEHAEDELITIDDSHFTDEIHEAEIRADDQLAADEARLEESIELVEDYENSNSIEQVNVPDDQTISLDDKPTNIETGDSVIISTELGNAIYNEGGRVEAPERTHYNNLIETENESGRNPERLG